MFCIVQGLRIFFGICTVEAFVLMVVIRLSFLAPATFSLRLRVLLAIILRLMEPFVWLMGLAQWDDETFLRW